MRQAGRSAATVLDRLCKFVQPGMSTLEIDEKGGALMEELGVKSACKGYRSGHRIFPSYTCLSVNDEVVHGIGVKERILKEGDVISVDVCIRQEGFIGDNCKTIPVGQVHPEVERLLRVTEESLYLGLSQALHKKRVGDVSHAVQSHVEKEGFAIITNFVGHGVGRSLHEDPQIPNFGKPGTGPQARKPKGKRPPSKEAAIRKPTQSKGKAKAVDALGSSSNQQQPAVGLRRSTRKRS